MTKCPTSFSSYLRVRPPPHCSWSSFHSQTGSDVTPVPSALGESLTVNRDDKTHQIAASTVIGWFLQYRRSFLVLSLGKEKKKKKVRVVVLPFSNSQFSFVILFFIVQVRVSWRHSLAWSPGFLEIHVSLNVESDSGLLHEHAGQQHIRRDEPLNTTV